MSHYPDPRRFGREFEWGRIEARLMLAGILLVVPLLALCLPCGVVFCGGVISVFTHPPQTRTDQEWPIDPSRHPETVHGPAEAEAKQKKEQEQEKTPGEKTTNSLGMRFAWIPPGTFLMGSPKPEEGRGDDETQHRVTLTKGFYLGIHQVTQAEWHAVMANNPSCFKGDDRPVEQVSWDDCQDFCTRLGAREGKHYRLPTEAEWEYACRAGSTTPFHCGETISTDLANYDGHYTYGNGTKGLNRQQTTRVCSFPPNAWGLFDMHGNVWEWCADRYGPYPIMDVIDYNGPQNGEYRVLRGGSWLDGPKDCRAAFRSRSAPTSRFSIGCRVCLD